MAVKVDESSFCSRCGLFVPVNHFVYRIKESDAITSEFVICADCAALWNEEIATHFVKWISEVKRYGKKE